MTEVVVTTGAIKRAKLQSKVKPSTNQHAFSYQPDALTVSLINPLKLKHDVEVCRTEISIFQLMYGYT